LQSSLFPGCFDVCTTGPAMSPTPMPSPSTPDPAKPPREMTRGDWFDLWNLIFRRR
jgi:hypothetical protein